MLGFIDLLDEPLDDRQHMMDVFGVPARRSDLSSDQTFKKLVTYLQSFTFGRTNAPLDLSEKHEHERLVHIRGGLRELFA